VHAVKGRLKIATAQSLRADAMRSRVVRGERDFGKWERQWSWKTHHSTLPAGGFLRAGYPHPHVTPDLLSQIVG
jgi:hypothetical protein